MSSSLHWIEPVLNRIERVGNRLPHPLTLFVLLAISVPILSFVFHLSGWSATHPRTGETLTVVNLLNAEGFRRMLTEAVTNFTGFAPLGTVLVAMIGIGVLERSGCLAAFLKILVAAAGQRFLTPALVFAGIMSSLTADAGYIILPPLGALVFASVGRHPFAGLCAVLSGVSGAFSANLFLTVLDPLLSGITHTAAILYDPDYVVTPLANYYFMVASTFLLVPLGWIVTEKIVEPRLGKWQAPDNFDLTTGSGPLLRREKIGLAWAGLTLVLCLTGIAFLVFPENALLREADGPLGGLAPFYDSIIILLALTLFFPGLVYGLITGSIRRDHDVAQMTGDTMSTMGVYIVLAFAAAQFIAYFDWSNMGMVFALQGAEFLRWTRLGDIPLLLGIIVIAGCINLVIGSASAKWAILAVVLVPMMMDLGYSPELSQAAFRVGDSLTNILTPISPYFPIILAFAQRYDKNIGIGSIIAAMLPYSVAFALGWTLLLTAWFLLGWPLGPDSPLFYEAVAN